MKTKTYQSLGKAILVIFSFGATANATTWDFDGEVSECNALACDLVGIGVGEPIAGFITASDEVSGPNSTFGFSDILDYGVAAQGVTAGPSDSSLSSATLTTDASGQLSSGQMVIEGQVDGGIFGPVDIEVTVDVGSGAWMVETELLGLGVVAAGPGQWLLEPDGDDVASILDNCIDVANPLQTDADADGHGNVCDADFNNDCAINFADLAIMAEGFFTADPLLDLDGSGVVNFGDLSILAELFFQPPGPSPTQSLCNP
ncbi:MAG: hypothetical protein KJO35_04685 [Gammaproteobacteria bacterium]|nr:hypothetical protein [Gammaproteobacteria bacterium]